MSKREIAEFYRRLAETRPIPQTELEFINPFTLLVAVVLSAQATDVGVNKATPALFALADTPAKMLALGEERVTELIRTIGLVSHQGKKPDRAEPDPGRAPRRRGAARARGARSAAGGRAQDRERGAERRLRRADDRRRHAYLPRRQPHRPRRRARRRSQVEMALEKRHAARIQALRASLADPARALCLQGAQARMPGLRRRRSVPLRGEDRTGGTDRRARLRRGSQKPWPTRPPARRWARRGSAKKRGQPATRARRRVRRDLAELRRRACAWMSPEIWPPHSISIWP